TALPHSVAISSCQPTPPGASSAGGCSWPPLSHLNNAIVAICGSTATEKRLMLGMSVGGTCTPPPSSMRRSAVASTSLTPTYPSPLGRKPDFLASSHRPISPLVETPPPVNNVEAMPGVDASCAPQPTTSV